MLRLTKWTAAMGALLLAVGCGPMEPEERQPVNEQPIQQPAEERTVSEQGLQEFAQCITDGLVVVELNQIICLTGCVATVTDPDLLVACLGTCSLVVDPTVIVTCRNQL
ncbi:MULTISPECIES: hypothetical protein [unclassified Corallococcus]|uniref:hypothetical protein n=1 Tax=unclassified Corallococcus TaxID=2685029 RepID=UPI001A8F4F94|nr:MULTISPECIES: hypothetical protein [unclassified Corallococcus]MBN9681277.1 hypothetical protein [Corallococcus sp. NCSPR001]WAS87143.1 hypothetical protein O0N60_09240 [Corallococcus sp. NCRR]